MGLSNLLHSSKRCSIPLLGEITKAEQIISACELENVGDEDESKILNFSEKYENITGADV